MNTPIQRILFGSPGTGKSYKIDKADDNIITTELGIKKEETKENIIKAVFHPEYTHGDFMGKLVPITRSGKVQYNFYEGHFLKALSQAYKNIIEVHDSDGKPMEGRSAKNVALVIDEINRGNSASIFGSVFQLLDRGDDGWSSYHININEIVFIRILELIGVEFSYNKHGEIDKYELVTSVDNIVVTNITELQSKIDFLGFDLINKSIKIPYNLSIIATMNTSDSSIYYMDSAFKRRWEWEFIDVDSQSVKKEGNAFNSRKEWENFAVKLNSFIKSNYKYIRGIEDKQVGYYFIKDAVVKKSTIQNKLMFFIWDSVFSRDKKPLIELLWNEKSKHHDDLVTFGDFASKVDLFIEKISSYHV